MNTKDDQYPSKNPTIITFKAEQNDRILPNILFMGILLKKKRYL